MTSLTHEPGFVYLLHFERPIAPGRHTAQHYIGHADDLAARIQAHERGRRWNRLGRATGCSRICEVAHERGIGFRVARVWVGGYELERRLKRRKEAPVLCPICNPNARRGLFELTAEQINEQIIPF